MSWSKRNPTWHRMHQRRYDEQIQAEARAAAEYQRQVPGLSRSDALRLAARSVARRGS